MYTGYSQKKSKSTFYDSLVNDSSFVISFIRNGTMLHSYAMFY